MNNKFSFGKSPVNSGEKKDDPSNQEKKPLFGGGFKFTGAPPTSSFTAKAPANPEEKKEDPSNQEKKPLFGGGFKSGGAPPTSSFTAKAPVNPEEKKEDPSNQEKKSLFGGGLKTGGAPPTSSFTAKAPVNPEEKKEDPSNQEKKPLFGGGFKSGGAPPTSSFTAKAPANPEEKKEDPSNQEKKPLFGGGLKTGGAPPTSSFTAKAPANPEEKKEDPSNQEKKSLFGGGLKLGGAPPTSSFTAKAPVNPEEKKEDPSNQEKKPLFGGGLKLGGAPPTSSFTAKAPVNPEEKKDDPSNQEKKPLFGGGFKSGGAPPTSSFTAKAPVNPEEKKEDPSNQEKKSLFGGGLKTGGAPPTSSFTAKSPVNLEEKKDESIISENLSSLDNGSLPPTSLTTNILGGIEEKKDGVRNLSIISESCDNTELNTESKTEKLVDFPRVEVISDNKSELKPANTESTNIKLNPTVEEIIEDGKISDNNHDSVSVIQSIISCFSQCTQRISALPRHSPTLESIDKVFTSFTDIDDSASQSMTKSCEMLSSILNEAQNYFNIASRPRENIQNSKSVIGFDSIKKKVDTLHKKVIELPSPSKLNNINYRICCLFNNCSKKTNQSLKMIDVSAIHSKLIQSEKTTNANEIKSPKTIPIKIKENNITKTTKPDLIEEPPIVKEPQLLLKNKEEYVPSNKAHILNDKIENKVFTESNVAEKKIDVNTIRVLSSPERSDKNNSIQSDEKMKPIIEEKPKEIKQIIDQKPKEVEQNLPPITKPEPIQSPPDSSYIDKPESALGESSQSQLLNHSITKEEHTQPKDSHETPKNPEVSTSQTPSKVGGFGQKNDSVWTKKPIPKPAPAPQSPISPAPQPQVVPPPQSLTSPSEPSKPNPIDFPPESSFTNQAPQVSAFGSLSFAQKANVLKPNSPTNQTKEAPETKENQEVSTSQTPSKVGGFGQKNDSVWTKKPIPKPAPAPQSPISPAPQPQVVPPPQSLTSPSEPSKPNPIDFPPESSFTNQAPILPGMGFNNVGKMSFGNRESVWSKK